MSEQEKQESQKTVVAFIAGLLIGGLLVWVFSGSSQPGETAPTNEQPDEISSVSEEDSNENESDNDDNNSTDSNNDAASSVAGGEVASLPVGDGDVSVADQAAGLSVSLAGATFPSDEGWIGVRDYNEGQMAGLLGVVRYSKEQGLVPEEIVLQRATVAGNTYAVVFYTENGDRMFNLAEDVQVGGAVDTFVAN